MLRSKVDAQLTLWKTLLPPEFLRLPPGLSEVDRPPTTRCSSSPSKSSSTPRLDGPSAAIDRRSEQQYAIDPQPTAAITAAQILTPGL